MPSPWIHKHRPKKQSDIIGQDAGVQGICDFISNFKKQKKNAALLYGTSGTGKTSSVHAIASDLNLELIEVNASDVRNKESLEATVGMSIAQQSLFFRGKIILIDEIDGVSGTKDRGGLDTLTGLIEKSHFPIVLTCENPYDDRLSKIASRSELIAFGPLDNASIVAILKNICIKEGIKADEQALSQLARMVDGDVRAAINDLQVLSGGKEKITREMLEELAERRRTESILQALIKVMKTTDAKIARDAFDTVNESIDERFLWLEENVPQEYEGEDLVRALDMISKASVFNSRIRRWQHWRFLVYVNALQSAGVATAKEQKYAKFVKYKRSGRILKMWWAKQKNAKKKAISEKLALHTHSSAKYAYKHAFCYFQEAARNDKKFCDSFAKELELDKEQAAFLAK